MPSSLASLALSVSPGLADLGPPNEVTGLTGAAAGAGAGLASGAGAALLGAALRPSPEANGLGYPGVGIVGRGMA